MTVNAFLPFAAAFICAGLGLGALYKEPRALVSRAFALGMLVLALREACTGLGMLATLPLGVWRWQLLRWTFTTMLPGSWLLFSLSFGRRDARDLVARWRWGVVGALALPLLAVTFFTHAMFASPVVVPGTVLPVLPLSWLGYVLCLLGLLGAVVVLVNLEGVLSASTGTKRRQVKFMLLGVGSVFASYVYTMSQTLLFAAVSGTAHSIDSSAVVLADLLIIVALVRHRLGSTQIAVSQTTLYKSLTVNPGGCVCSSANMVEPPSRASAWLSPCHSQMVTEGTEKVSATSRTTTVHSSLGSTTEAVRLANAIHTCR